MHLHLALPPSPPSTPAVAVRPPAMPPRTPLTPNQQRIRVRVLLLPSHARRAALLTGAASRADR